MPQKPQTRRRASKKEQPQGPRSVPMFLHQEEVNFLFQALQNMPISGTPDQLAQVLQVIQGLRVKVAQAGVALGMFVERPPDGAPPAPVETPPEQPAAAAPPAS